MSVKYTQNYSPNFSTYTRNRKSIKFIIIHYTGMRSEIKAINRLTDVNSKVSCHYFIKNNGKILLMVPEKYTAWHAGKSEWKKFKFLNKYSIGIEFQNPGHQHKYSAYSKKQIKSIIKLCYYLKKKYFIHKKNILGHSDVAFKRKKDPGEKFPWRFLADNKISYWHNLNEKKLSSLRKKIISREQKIEFLKNIRKIGYSFKKYNIKNKLLILAFQRRFRIKLIDGKIDKECLIISRKLSKIR